MKRVVRWHSQIYPQTLLRWHSQISLDLEGATSISCMLYYYSAPKKQKKTTYCYAKLTQEKLGTGFTGYL
jgi:hypothetical protein